MCIQLLEKHYWLSCNCHCACVLQFAPRLERLRWSSSRILPHSTSTSPFPVWEVRWQWPWNEHLFYLNVWGVCLRFHNFTEIHGSLLWFLYPPNVCCTSHCYQKGLMTYQASMIVIQHHVVVLPLCSGCKHCHLNLHCILMSKIGWTSLKFIAAGTITIEMVQKAKGKVPMVAQAHQ